MRWFLTTSLLEDSSNATFLAKGTPPYELDSRRGFRAIGLAFWRTALVGVATGSSLSKKTPSGFTELGVSPCIDHDETGTYQTLSSTQANRNMFLRHRGEERG